MPPRRIRDVWAYNLAAEMEHLRDVAEQFPYVAMDTECAGRALKGQPRSTKRWVLYYAPRNTP